MNYIINKNKKIIKQYDFNFDFLDDFKEYIDINSYYDIFNSLDDIGIKNIYNYLFIKWYIIKNKLSLNEPILIKQNIYEKHIFNNIIKEFIKNDISLAIFVINSTLRYI